jgi:hypothetical protein
MKHFQKVISSVVVILFSLSIAVAYSADVTVEFTEVPKAGAGAGSQGNIAGVVKGISSPENYKIILYAHTNWWYVQPLTTDPYTDISGTGSWSNWTHLGYRYAALVVRKSYHPEAKIMTLPHVGGDVIARGEVAATP